MTQESTFDGKMNEICNTFKLVVATPVVDTSERIPVPRGERRCFSIIGANKAGTELLFFAFGLDVEGDEAEEERTIILNALAEKDVVVINTDHPGAAACIALRLWPCAKSKEFYDIAVQVYGAEAMGEVGRFVGKRFDAINRLPDTADNVVPLNKRVH